MKKYTTPSLKVITAFSTDIIQTSSEVTEVSMPKTVVRGVGGTQETAASYGASDFTSAYGITSVAD